MISKEKAFAKWPQEFADASHCRVETFLSAIPTLEKLREFWDDTKDLTWPETYGSSPWEFASSVAYQVFNEKARHPVPGLIERAEACLAGDSQDLGLASYYKDQVRAVRAIELNMILDGGMAPNFGIAVFRALEQGFLAGDKPVKLQDGTDMGDVRYVAFEQTGLYFEPAPFFAVLRQAGTTVHSSDVLVYVGKYPDDAMAAPVLSYPMKKLLRGNAAPSLDELARIFRNWGGKGGYQWGNTRGADANFGAENLTHLVLLGYAKRTGRETRNQLGGVWPEIELTPAGIRTVIESGVLLEQQRQSPGPVAAARGSWGEFECDAKTGAVLGPIYGIGATDPEFDHGTAPVRIDVAELRSTYPDEEIGAQSYNVLDLGFTTAAGEQVEPDQDWREEFRRETSRLYM